MKYLLDTNICIYYFKNQFDLAQKFHEKGIHQCAISEITYAELLYGAEKSQNVAKNMQKIDELLKQVAIIPVYNGLKIYSKEKAKLSSMGRLISDFDLLIGATAIAYDMIMVTRNMKEFERLDNIKLENWVDDYHKPTLREEIYKLY
ncbi:type II toxin-antitoxin system VapC family toxin [Moraxella sp. K127]|uniref:type II toxin-antitoxin system VapC family toxin n=1 Tax=Moraxella TaxID=475 RepID=UPI0018805EE7|nr:type II toxin-antitoxin system VapC family toxin [Moraxella sp. K127]MBE9589743.1 type II toxin-antitoxin system VapC family toxin [Moraxella sp. K127]